MVTNFANVDKIKVFLTLLLSYPGSTVVEHSTHDPKIKGSNLVSCRIFEHIATKTRIK